MIIAAYLRPVGKSTGGGILPSPNRDSFKLWALFLNLTKEAFEKEYAAKRAFGFSESSDGVGKMLKSKDRTGVVTPFPPVFPKPPQSLQKLRSNCRPQNPIN